MLLITYIICQTTVSAICFPNNSGPIQEVESDFKGNILPQQDVAQKDDIFYFPSVPEEERKKKKKAHKRKEGKIFNFVLLH